MPSPTSSTFTAERREARLPVPRSESACVEFAYPQPAGRRRKLSLLDLSEAGLRFALPFYGLSGVVSRTRLCDVLVRIGSCEIEGQLTVKHVTRESEARLLCGGRFRPATDCDRLQWTKALAGLKSFEDP